MHMLRTCNLSDCFFKILLFPLVLSLSHKVAITVVMTEKMPTLNPAGSSATSCQIVQSSATQQYWPSRRSGFPSDVHVAMDHCLILA